MTNEEIRTKAEELYGKVNNSFPISEFVNEEKRNCFVAGAKWAEQQMIEKACEWLDNNQRTYREYDESGFYHERSQHLIKDFKKAMKGGEE